MRTHLLKRAALAVLAAPLLVSTVATGATAEPPGAAADSVDVMVFVHAPREFVGDTPAEVVYELGSSGEGPRKGTQIVAPVPPDFEFLRYIRTRDWDCAASTATQFDCTLTRETPGALLGVLLIPRDGPDRTVTFTATVSGPGPDPNPANNSASDEATVKGSATVEGIVWHDQDRDGLRDESEPGLAGRRVALYDVSDGTPSLWDARLTDATGKHSFAGVPLSKYRIVVHAPDETWTFTTPDVGDDDAIDSDVRIVTNGALAKITTTQAPTATSEIVVLDGWARTKAVIDAGLLTKATPSATPTATPSESSSASPSASASPSSAPTTLSPTAAPGSSGSPLPTTGAALTGRIAAGLLLLGGGALLTLIARRRRAA